MTTTQNITVRITAEELRHVATESLIEAIVTDRSDWPPDGWCEQFDAAHSYIPGWATDGDKPHERFVLHCRNQSGEHMQAKRHALSNSLRRWLWANQSCPELARAVRNAKRAYDDREEDPQGWAQYARHVEINNDVPY